MKRMVKPLCLIVLALSLNSCAAQRKEAPVHLFDLANEKGRMEMTARQFISAYYSKNQDQILNLSGYPFYMDDGGVLIYPEEWREALSKIFALKTTLPYQIQTLKILQPADIPSLNMQVWNRLMELKYHKMFYALADIQITTPQGLAEEKVLLIMHKDPDTEIWKILGFFS